jgi:hypothetical protein
MPFWRDAALRDLFARLAGAPSAREASVVEFEIWSAWHEIDDDLAAPWMQRGLAALEVRDLATALSAFDRVTGCADRSTSRSPTSTARSSSSRGTSARCPGSR